MKLKISLNIRYSNYKSKMEKIKQRVNYEFGS